MPDRHCLFSPSGSSRWLQCSASLLPGGEESEDKGHAAEGTVAHAVCEQYFRKQSQLDEALGTEIDGITVTQEMVDGARLYYQTINDLLDEFHDRSPYAEIETFQQSDWCKDFGGTIDCTIRGDDLTIVVDYKFGRVPVEVVGNTQLLCYLLLACEQYYDEHHVYIVQPRANHDDGPARGWQVRGETLAKFRHELGAVIAQYNAKEVEAEAGKHCLYCNHKHHCKKLAVKVTDMMEEAEDYFFLDTDDIVELLDLERVVKGFFERLREQVAKDMTEGKRRVTGYKVVNKFSRRKWRDEQEVMRVLSEQGFEQAEVLEAAKLKSPYQLKGIVGEAVVNSLSKVEVTGTTVVPESDKRPGLDAGSVRKEFKNE